MSLTVLVFVNLSRQDAHLWAVGADGVTQFAATLASGGAVRQLSAPEQKWTIVSEENYTLTATDKNRVYFIGSSGVYEVDQPKPLTAESGAVPADFDFPSYSGGGWP